jgi:ketoreductase
MQKQGIRTALVTGAGRGIGKAIALSFAKEGIFPILVARTESQLRSVAEKIGELRGETLIAPCDVSVQEDVRAMIKNVHGKIGKIDILVNCAGRGGGGYTSEMDDDLWHDIISTNFHSVYYVTKAVLNEGNMVGPGTIINIASTGGKQGVIYAAAYCASKHGVVGFTKALGLELARKGITVNAICPGFVETELAEKARQGYGRIWNVSVEEAKKRIEERVPIGRYIEPEEVAEMAVYLASEKARGITAQAINICGGLGNY